MTNRKSAGKSLLTSVIAVLVCIAMFAGVTYAWFTDTASTGISSIQAGTLDIEIVKAVDGSWTETDSLEWKKADSSRELLWEPGGSYELDTFKIVNKGNLSLEYEVFFYAKGDLALLDVLTVSVEEADDDTLPASIYDNPVDGVILENKESIDSFVSLSNVITEPTDENGLSSTDYTPRSGVLAGNTETKAMKIVVKMNEDAGNEYQGMSLEDVKISVRAKQYSGESDSYGNTYDDEDSGAGYDTESEDSPAATLNGIAFSDFMELLAYLIGN